MNCSLWRCIHRFVIKCLFSIFNSFHSVFFYFPLLFLKSAFESFESLFVFLSLTSLPASPFSLTFSSSSSLYHPALYGGKRERRPEIDVGPAHTETGSWLNRSDRSGTEHLLCQTAGPLWMEIISKLLQEADACQKMLSVKVRLLQCCIVLTFPLSHFCFSIFLNSSAFSPFISQHFFLSCKGFSVI